ncbi:hypothetical protein V500_03634, partial [Pseudogymnoascus sp. VKM F-4518 (FW-2643)]
MESTDYSFSIRSINFQTLQDEKPHALIAQESPKSFSRPASEPPSDSQNRQHKHLLPR